MLKKEGKLGTNRLKREGRCGKEKGKK